MGNSLDEMIVEVLERFKPASYDWRGAFRLHQIRARDAESRVITAIEMYGESHDKTAQYLMEWQTARQAFIAFINR